MTFGCSATSLTAEDLRASLPGVVVDEVAILDPVAPDVLATWQVDEQSNTGTVVHVADGSELTLRSEPLLDLAERASRDLVDAGADVVLYGCAGPLPSWPSTAVTLSPHRLLHAYLDGAPELGRVGMLVPSALHVESTIADYSDGRRTVTCRAASPRDEQAVTAALDALAAGGADVLVLTCFDHTLDELRAARRRVAMPVTSSRQLSVAAIAAAFPGGGAGR